MKVLLLLLLAAGQAHAGSRQATVRVYSLSRAQAVDLEPAGGTAHAAGKPLTGRARVTARGAQVLLDAPQRDVRQQKFSAGGGVWLSGRGLPRRLYGGELTFTSRGGRLLIVNRVPLEEYIAAVVSGEASDLSHPEAYKAQAVAARTYTVNHPGIHAGEDYDLCDSAHCQVYAGSGAVKPRARAAAEATAGEILLYKGAPAETYYHSVCGGRTADMTSVWPFERKPYLVPVKDGPPAHPYCSIAPDFRWKTRIYFTGLTRLARQAGWIVRDEQAQDLRVISWVPSGRAAALEIRTQRRKVRITATDFYHGIGRRAGWRAVRSTRFRILQGRDHVLLDGFGSGHGVGMCQWGAEGMGRMGFKYRDILKHYYPGTEIRK